MRTRSPFPGMDPYLERHWLDVHHKLTDLAADAIQEQLGDDLVARTDERVFVELPSESATRPIGPDVRVVEVGPAVAKATATAPRGTATPPVLLAVDPSPIRQALIEVRDFANDGRVVTVIEFTSASNKRPGRGRRLYRQKQDECYDADVNLVEVDLTRAGRRQLLAQRWPESRGYRTPYAASVWRAAKPHLCAIYPIRLQDRLPTLAVPLRPTDADVTLDLQSLVDAAYRQRRYGRTIDYTRPPDPPLSAEDAEWAATLLTASPDEPRP